jgi:hypothetical protein
MREAQWRRVNIVAENGDNEQISRNEGEIFRREAGRSIVATKCVSASNTRRNKEGKAVGFCVCLSLWTDRRVDVWVCCELARGKGWILKFVWDLAGPLVSDVVVVVGASPAGAAL